MFSDSNESTDSLSKIITQKRTNKCNIKFGKIVKRKINSNCMCSSDSESEDDITRALSISKRISKDTRRQNKKMESCNAESKESCHDWTSDFEDEVHKIRNREKHSETRWVIPQSNDERKCDKSLMGLQLSYVQKNDSNDSSSKELKKKTLQKVNRNKCSMRQLANLEIDHTKSPSIKNSTNDESEKHINKRSNRNLNDIKQILRDYKKICSNFQMYIEIIEQLYGKKDKKQFILKAIEKIDKLRTMLEEKQKDLTTSYQLWFRNEKRSAVKRLYKVVRSNESSEEYEKRTVDNKDKCIFSDEQDENKAVSECDSEEIFSANETTTLQKIQKTQRKADILRTENNVNSNGPNIDDEGRISVDESKNNNKNMDIGENLTTSPILGTGDTLKEKKTSMRVARSERSNKKQLFFECNKNNNKIQLTKEDTNTNDKQASLRTDIYDETEIEDSLSRNNKKSTLGNYRVNKSNKKNIINDSIDMFDTFFENTGKNRTEVEIETNCDKAEFSYTSKDKFLELCESLLQNNVPSEKERASLLFCNIGKEKNLLSQNEQKNIASVISENDSKASEKTNTDDNKSLDNTETLAKKVLLETDFDTFDLLPDENVAKLTEDLITKDTRTEKKNKMEDNDSDVNNISIVLSTFIKEANTKIKEKSDDWLDKRFHKEMSSLGEDTKTEKAAKRPLFKSNSNHNSTLLLSELGKLTDKKSDQSKSDSPEKYVKARPGSSNENFSPELTLFETTNVSKNIKRNHEPESDGESMVARLKKKKFRFNKNHHYKNDKKLRMSCKVYLTRLSAETLKYYSHALRKSREYLEHRALKSLVNLDKLEKKRKKNTKRDSDLLTDDDLKIKNFKKLT